MKIGVFYGSTTGNTEDVALLLPGMLKGQDVYVHNLSDEGLSGFADYDLLILGIPTWDYGEIQEDWQEIWDELGETDLSGCTVALFGLGDQVGYGEWFLDAMGLLHDLVRQQGAAIIGYWPVAGYEFEASKAVSADGEYFVGLALDEDCQHGETEERLMRWTQQIMDQYQNLADQ